MSNVVEHCQLPQPVGYACTREDGHPGACAWVQNQPADFLPTPPLAPHETKVDKPSPPMAPAPDYITRDWQAIFDVLGSNWNWASVDYRGVARVHTFQPEFGPSGRILMPAFKANSDPAPAFDIAEVPPHWRPLKVSRITAPPYATDRFGKILPAGADPVEAADVIEGANPTTVLTDGIDNPKYNISRSEQCRCEITAEQMGDIIRRELGIDPGQDINVFAHSSPSDHAIAISVEWRRALS